MKRKTGTKVMQEQTKENKLPVVLLAVIIVVLLVGSIVIGIFGGGGKKVEMLFQRKILKLQERQQSFQMRGKFRRLQSTKILL
ncbi:MAG: hypothetical protein U0I35_02170 [Dorea formicigenerans]|nr:hypothetical protein [Dorea formicigenerans]